MGTEKGTRVRDGIDITLMILFGLLVFALISIIGLGVGIVYVVVNHA